MNKTIDRINYRKPTKNLDFEIVDLQRFFSTRPKERLESDYRINFWTIIYVVEGSGKHYVDFTEYSYKKGDIIFVHKNQVHRYKTNGDVRGFVIHINEPFFYRVEGFNGDVFLEFADKALGSPVLSFDTSKDHTNRILIDLICREYAREVDSVNAKLIATLFQAFILSLKSQVIHTPNEQILNSKDYEHFKYYRQLVEENYKVTRNVESYADMMHLSKKTINQATRKVVGLSAKAFIVNRIVLEIKRYLSQGDLMNYEIADELGFVEAANMTKFFKHYEGISPKVFRENLLMKQ